MLFFVVNAWLLRLNLVVIAFNNQSLLVREGLWLGTLDELGVEAARLDWPIFGVTVAWLLVCEQ